MSSKPSILVVGLPIDPSAPPLKVPWSEAPVSIHDELKQFEAKMRERGYDEQTLGLGNLRPGHVVEDLTPQLKARDWAGVIVGGGFRSLAPMTAGLEDLVNTVKDISPSSRILFIAQGPLSALDTVERFERHWASQKAQ